MSGSVKKKKITPRKQKSDTHVLADTLKVLILKAMERGQLVSFGLILALVIIAKNLSGDNVEHILIALLAGNGLCYVGWLLFLITTLVLGLIIRSERKLNERETGRLMSEKEYWESQCISRLKSQEGGTKND